MQATLSFQATRPAVASRPAARRSVVVMAAAKPEVSKQQKAALVSLAAFAAAVLVNCAPAQADGVKTVVCASNPTAKACLKNSAKN